jgi:hypothetical protein
MIELKPRTNENGDTVLDVHVRGKATKVFLEFDAGGDPTWVPGSGYSGPPTEPAVIVVTRTGKNSCRYRPISGPTLFQDLALDLLLRFT